jgi:hypothetical protein
MLVGASRVTRPLIRANCRSIARATGIAVTPGPPVITGTLEARARCTACFWLSASSDLGLPIRWPAVTATPWCRDPQEIPRLQRQAYRC